jgi:very-short-patch-repair endonuclease
MRGKPRLRTFAREMRSAPTDAEEMLWKHLRDRGLSGAKFRRQVPIGRYVVDFLCPAARLIVELDGGVHRGGAYDQNRDGELRQLGFRILRIRNEQVTSGIGTVLSEIALAMALVPPHPAAAPPPSPARGEGHRPPSEDTP